MDTETKEAFSKQKPPNPINDVIEKVGVYGFGGGSSQKRIKYVAEDEDEHEDGNMEMKEIAAERTKTVLILMSDTGGGHRASAEAIKNAFQIEFADQYRV